MWYVWHNPRFFLGTDSAPHAQGAKETYACRAGCFNAPVALGLYAEAFERYAREGATINDLWNTFEDFCSVRGREWYTHLGSKIETPDRPVLLRAGTKRSVRIIERLHPYGPHNWVWCPFESRWDSQCLSV